MNITVASVNFIKIPVEILHLQLPAPVTASGAPTYTCSLHKSLFEASKTYYELVSPNSLPSSDTICWIEKNICEGETRGHKT